MAPSSNNLHKRRQRRQLRHECPEYMYYDEAISGCDHCDPLCDHYEVQGTEKLCKEKCYNYYIRLSSTQPTLTSLTTTRKPHRPVTMVTKSGHLPKGRELRLLENDKGNAILAVVVVLLALAILGALGFMFWKKRKNVACCRRRGGDDVKTSVPCSEEDGLHNAGDSKKPLMGSSGPIRQAEDGPQQDITVVNRQLAPSGGRSVSYPLTFAEFGGARYAVLDGPLSSEHRHSTVPKEFVDESVGTSVSQNTVPKEAFSEDSTEHFNTNSVRSEGEHNGFREHDLSAS